LKHRTAEQRPFHFALAQNTTTTFLTVFSPTVCTIESRMRHSQHMLTFQSSSRRDQRSIVHVSLAGWKPLVSLSSSSATRRDRSAATHYEQSLPACPGAPSHLALSGRPVHSHSHRDALPLIAALATAPGMGECHKFRYDIDILTTK